MVPIANYPFFACFNWLPELLWSLCDQMPIYGIFPVLLLLGLVAMAIPILSIYLGARHILWFLGGFMSHLLWLCLRLWRLVNTAGRHALMWKSLSALTPWFVKPFIMCSSFLQEYFHWLLIASFYLYVVSSQKVHNSGDPCHSLKWNVEFWVEK